LIPYQLLDTDTPSKEEEEEDAKTSAPVTAVTVGETIISGTIAMAYVTIASI
jgi:hypothetical protein